MNGSAVGPRAVFGVYADNGDMQIDRGAARMLATDHTPPSFNPHRQNGGVDGGRAVEGLAVVDSKLVEIGLNGISGTGALTTAGADYHNFIRRFHHITSPRV